MELSYCKDTKIKNIMESENKKCQNCKKDFIIEPEDFAFYEKMKVPPPTFCPECRLIRRLAWRNELVLFKRKNNVPGSDENIISVFPPEANVVAFDSKYWWSDNWDPLGYGQNYDFSKPFFKQFKNFIQCVPWIALSETKMTDCDYCNVAEGCKDCYLASAIGYCERVMYANRVVSTKDSADLYISDKNELCYELINCQKSYRLLFSVDCVECSNSAFLYECRNCQSCFGCTNLRNKQYCFFNAQYTKNEYEEKIKLYNIGSVDGIERARCDFDLLKVKSIRRYAKIIKSTNSTGDNISNAKNAKKCFDVVGSPSAEDIKYCVWAGYGLKDALDSGPGVAEGELYYEIFDAQTRSSNLRFAGVVYGSLDVQYSINCHGSRHLFGCYGLRNKEYCILNKQYSKEEYETLVSKIIEHMNDMPYVDVKGRVYRYGEFFPIEISPFAYNETIANDYFPLTKEEVEQKGFLWREPIRRDYQITKFVVDIPNNIVDVSDEFTKEIIECSHQGKCGHGCTTAFKVTIDELNLYRKLGVALPRMCFNCRHRERLARRNPLKLWHRKCMKPGCNNEFETSYAPDRPEIVYCESCYNQEVA